jgi:DNA helicase HerA-like ATPase
MEHPIPDAVLDDRLGFIGMTGSGKTYGTGTCIERILAKGDRVVILDPLGVWWGLRQMADGKTASPYEIVIFGGPHADLPITPNAGAIIGETVAGMGESAIIDLSQFETAAAERRFMLAFLDALYRRSVGDPVHLIFDEADMWGTGAHPR